MKSLTIMLALLSAALVVDKTQPVPAPTCDNKPVAAAYEAAQPQVIMEVLDSSLDQYTVLWRNEIARRFPHAVGVLVHGGDFEEGKWIVGNTNYGHRIMPITEVVKHFQERYPDRTIVLLACNTGHLKLGMPNVFYSMSSVWCVPDRALTPAMMKDAKQKLDDPEDDGGYSAVPSKSRWEEDPDVTGNIFEFVKE